MGLRTESKHYLSALLEQQIDMRIERWTEALLSELVDVINEAGHELESRLKDVGENDGTD